MSDIPNEPVDPTEGQAIQGQAAKPEQPVTQSDNVVNIEAEAKKRGRPPRPPRKPTNDWRDKLLRTETYALQAKSHRNVRLFFENHESFKGAFALDTWRSRPVIVKEVPWSEETNLPAHGRPLIDEDLIGIIEILEDHGQRGFSAGTLADVVQAMCSRKKFNPLTDWLKHLKWDGKPRINTWLTYYLGAIDTPYARLIAPKYLIGAVARAMQPGCKMDNILILEGEQGRYKSTALRALFGDDYFTDQLSELGSKDCSMQMQGVWCVELPELTNLDRSSSRQIKEWLARTTERFRPPFSRAIRDFPRQCVIAGTTNPSGGYLRDSTGARRFWPIAVHTCDVEALRADRDQLWAEAVHRYRSGEAHYLTAAMEHGLASQAQRARFDRDVWHEAVSSYVAGRNWVTIHEILSSFSISQADMDHRTKMRVSETLTFIGWEQRIVKVNGRATRVYVPGPNASQFAIDLLDDETSPDAVEEARQQPVTVEEPELEL